jgi:hypothetical protein
MTTALGHDLHGSGPLAITCAQAPDHLELAPATQRGVNEREALHGAGESGCCFAAIFARNSDRVRLFGQTDRIGTIY